MDRKTAILEWREINRGAPHGVPTGHTLHEFAQRVEALAIVDATKRYEMQIKNLCKDSARLIWLLAEEAVPEGFSNIALDRYDYAIQVADEYGRYQPTDADLLEGLRRLIDAAMVAAPAVGDA